MKNVKNVKNVEKIILKTLNKNVTIAIICSTSCLLPNAVDAE